MSWLDAFTSWVTDPNNISGLVPSVVVLLCTIALIITVSVSVRRASIRIERAVNGESYRYDQKSTRRERSDRRDRSEPSTGPLRTGTAPVQTTAAAAPAAEPAPAPAQTHVAAPAEPLTPPPAVAPTPVNGSVAPPLPPSMTTPPPSAQAFARASALDNDPLNQ